MRQDPHNTHRKLFASLAILSIVFLIAAIAQFTGSFRKAEAANGVGDARPGVRQPRAVFGDVRPETSPRRPGVTPEVTPGVESAATKDPESEKEAARSRTESPTNRSEIDGLLDRWRDTYARGDVNGQVILYAPKMELFYRRNGVSRETVRREKLRMMELYPKVHRYDISDVKLETHNHEEAIVSFRKDWDMNGDRRFSGAERQRLKLKRINGDWKIVREEELKVYWVKRG